MPKLLWANNASTTLASGITDTDTTLNVASGDGSEFPSPGGSESFMATLADGDGNIEIVEVTERTLGDLTDEDARKEGMRDLEQYREILNRAHDDFEWSDDSEVVLHRFEKVEA